VMAHCNGVFLPAKFRCSLIVKNLIAFRLCSSDRRYLGIFHISHRFVPQPQRGSHGELRSYRYFTDSSLGSACRASANC
jgi:hypothetical protein